MGNAFLRFYRSDRKCVYGITIIYDLGTVGDGSADFTLYFDDIVFDEVASVVDLQSLGINYFPNPATDVMNISGTDQLEEVEVYNMSGALMMSQKLSGNTADINVSGLIAESTS